MPTSSSRMTDGPTSQPAGRLPGSVPWGLSVIDLVDMVRIPGCSSNGVGLSFRARPRAKRQPEMDHVVTAVVFVGGSGGDAGARLLIAVTSSKLLISFQ